MPDEVAQNAFIGGEISPELRMRSDQANHVTGLSLCENFIVRPQGGIIARPGTQYVGDQKSHSARGRLIPFSFNTEQNYVLLFENNVMRVIKDAGYVETSPSVPYELVTTYTSAQLSRLTFTQDADVMTICHPDHDPKRLVRVTETNWTLTNVDYSASVSPPTVPASAAVGTASGLANKTYRYVITAVNSDGKESLATSETSVTLNEITTTYGVRVSWTASVDSDIEYYRVYRDASGSTYQTSVYSWIGDTETTNFEDYNIAPDTSDSPPTDFLPFAGADDKPAAVGYFQQRQIFANTNDNPQDIFATQIGDYESMRFSRPARANDAVFFTLKSTKVNEIRHIVDMDSLIFFTSGGEWKLTEGQDRVLSPFTIGMRRQSSWGSSWAKPAEVGDSIVFIQEKGNKVRDLYLEVSGNQGKYTGNELSVMAYHLFQGYQIEELAYAEEPNSVLWCVRDDGKLLGLTYKREHGVWAWHQHKTLNADGTDAVIESIAVISDGNRDVPYLTVKRTVNSVTQRFVERLEADYNPNTDEVADSWHLDSAVEYSGAAATVFTGMDHLDGDDVYGLADGNVVGPLTVSSGSVTIPNASEKVLLGLRYQPVIQDLDVEPGEIKASYQGRQLKVSNVAIKFKNSRGGWVAPVEDDGTIGTYYEIKPRYDSDAYTALDLKSFTQEVTVDSGWEKGGRIRIEQRDPLPMTILSTTKDVDIS